MIVLVGSSCLAARPAFATTTFTVTNTNDSGAGSLRQAILDANSNSGADMITFSIGSGPVTISPSSPLPTITDPVVVDGTTQPGMVDDPIVEIDGTNINGNGLDITAGGSTIRGLVINNFGGIGVRLSGNGGNKIEDNFIGTDVSGTTALPNYVGMAIDGSPNNTIGGTTDYAGNLISGNDTAAMTIGGSAASGNLVQGNIIGADITGEPLPNFEGILITGRNNTIGGTADGAGNLIAYHDGQYAIAVSGATATGNAILGNSIFDNLPLGISLSGYSPTPNDPGDSDTGPNNLQNYPVLSSAISSNGSIAITGSLNSTPNAEFRLEFFDNSTVESDGYSEGESFLGFQMVRTDGAGNAHFSMTFDVAVPLAHFISSTATDSGNNTSEFSRALRVDAPGLDVSSWGPGRLDLFVRGSHNELVHKWYQGGWSNFESLGGVLTSDPGAVSWGPNRIDTFVRGTDGGLYHRWWDGGAWRGYEPLGGVIVEGTGPDVASWGAGRLDVFVKGTDNQLWHRWYDGGWSGWEALGGVLASSPTAVSWGPGRLDVFVRGTDDRLWHKWFNGRWSGWEPLGWILSSGPDASAWSTGPNAPVWNPGHLDVFVRGGLAIGSENTLVHRIYQSGWYSFDFLGGNLTSDPGAVSWGPNRTDVFVRGTDNGIWHKWWGGVSWSGWEPQGSP